MVLDINREKERVSLGLKQKLANPWDSIEQKYPVGAKVKGRVVNLVPYGAFVELEPGVEGLVHVTELSWTKRIAKPSDVLKPDQEIEAVVLGINREEQKISLGLRQLEANPWDKAQEKYPPGTTRQRQDSQPHQLRRLHRAGGRPGRHDPRLRHVLDAQDQSPLGSHQEGRRGGSRRAGSGQGQPAHRRRHEAAHARPVGKASTSSTRSATSSPARSPSWPASAPSSACSMRSTAWCTSRRSARSASTRSRTCSRSDQEVTARVIKIDKSDRRIGLSIKAANYSNEQLKAEQAALDALKPGEDLVALQHAFDAADEAKADEAK